MLDLPTSSPSPPLPRRRLVVAVEGTDGTGKSTLVAALAAALAAQHIPHLTIKRPAAGSLAHRLLVDALPRGQSSMWDGRIIAAMDADARNALAHAASLSPGCVAILDRHWPSACVENYPDLPHALAEQRARHGEPDLWIFCTADWRTIHARLTRRGGHDARQTPRAIGGRLAAYEWLMGEMRAEVLTVDPSGVALGAGWRAHCPDSQATAVYIAAHIRYMMERP